MTVILIKSLTAVVGAVAFSIGIRFQERVLHVPEPTANQLLLVAFAACRLMPFVVIYLLMGIDPHSDVPVFYDAAGHALWGGVVYSDFWSPYSPLFAYVTALPLLIWHGLKSIVLLMVIIEGIAWWMPRPVLVLLLLNVLVAVQPSLWCYLGSPVYSNPTTFARANYLVEYLMEIGIVGSVGYFVWLAYRQTEQKYTLIEYKVESQPVSHG